MANDTRRIARQKTGNKFMIIDGKKVFEYAEDAQPVEARNDGMLMSNRQGTNYGLLSGNTIVNPTANTRSISLRGIRAFRMGLPKQFAWTER